MIIVSGEYRLKVQYVCHNWFDDDDDVRRQSALGSAHEGLLWWLCGRQVNIREDDRSTVDYQTS